MSDGELLSRALPRQNLQGIMGIAAGEDGLLGTTDK